MHPFHLEVLASDRRRELLAAADAHRLTSESRAGAAIRPRARRAALVPSLGSLMRRLRREQRARDRIRRATSRHVHELPVVSVPLRHWRAQR
ncbi:MAG TPA: hypothetical protein VGP92_00075 [Acidimicrobiia bacterium]|jgi:hypothetical protein|nr:hypothetical protein [Acidimicrobiia bacterium]